MNEVVLDTDVASYIFNEQLRGDDYRVGLAGCDLILSFMTVAELRAGALMAGWGHRRCADLEGFIRGHQVIYADDYMCSVWASVRSELQAIGRPVTAQDAWVAATALSVDAPLATNNRRDFQHIRQLRLLSS